MLKSGTRHFLIILVALIIGGAVGGLIYKSRMNKLAEAANTKIELRVLALQGMFRPELLKKIEAEQHIRINLVEANDPEALWDLFDAPGGTPYDVVSLMSYQVPAAMQMTRLLALNASKLDWLKISSDFRDIPGDPTHNHAMPILWGLTGMLYNTQKFPEPPETWREVLTDGKRAGRVGALRSPIDVLTWLGGLSGKASERDESSDVGPSDQDIAKDLKPILKQVKFSKTSLSSMDLVNRENAENSLDVIQINAAEAGGLSEAKKTNWKFALPQNTSPLWILSLAVTNDSKMSAESLGLLNALTETEFAKSLSQTSHQSSTMLSTESSSLAAIYKPSYLRQIPLTKIQMEHDFLGARAVHEALEGTGDKTVIDSSTSE